MGIQLTPPTAMGSVRVGGAPDISHNEDNRVGPVESIEYPCNIIPANRINTVGENIANYYPLPASAPAYYGDPDITGSSSSVSKGRQYVGKVDEQFFPWWRASASYMHTWTIEPGPEFFGGPAANGQWALWRVEDVTAITSLLTISPTTVLAVRYGFNRFPNLFYTTSERKGFDPTTLGFPASYVGQMMGHKFPIINTSTALTLSDGNGSYYNLVSNNFSTILSRIQGPERVSVLYTSPSTQFAAFSALVTATVVRCASEIGSGRE